MTDGSIFTHKKVQAGLVSFFFGGGDDMKYTNFILIESLTLHLHPDGCAGHNVNLEDNNMFALRAHQLVLHETPGPSGGDAHGRLEIWKHLKQPSHFGGRANLIG